MLLLLLLLLLDAVRSASTTAVLYRYFGYPPRRWSVSVGKHTFFKRSNAKSASEFWGHSKMQPTSVSAGASVFTVRNRTPSGTWPKE